MSGSTIKVVLVAYPDSFSSDEAKNLVESAAHTKITAKLARTSYGYQIIKIFTQRYLNHSKYGIGSGKAEEIKEFVMESKSDKIVVDEHLQNKFTILRS